VSVTERPPVLTAAPRPAVRAGRRRARTAVPLGLIVGLAVGVPIASAWVTGAVHLPWNDDWAYARVALDLARTGELRLVGWGVMGLVGHVLWAQPWLAALGAELWVLRTAQAVAAAAGLVATYAFARAFLRRPRALLATALVAATPGYATLAATFMTDTTAYALQMGCLALGAAALRRGRPVAAPLLAGALVLGVAAVTVRELTLTAPAAVLAAAALAIRSHAAHLADRGRGSMRQVVVGAAAVAVAVGAFAWWRAGLPGVQLPGPPAAPRVVGGLGLRAFATAALVLAPALALGPRVRLLRGERLAALAGAVAGAVGVLATGGDPIAGNVLERSGALGDEVALGVRGPLFAPAAWGALTAAAGGAAIALAALLAAATARAARRRAWRRAVPGDALLGVPLVGGAAGVLAQAVAGGAAFDRYLWPLVAAGAVALLRGGPLRRWADGRWTAARGGAVVLAGLSLLLTLDAQVYTAARWAAGQRAGGDPLDVDAGFEWAGWHDPGPTALAATGPLPPPRISAPHPGYLLLFRGMGNCHTVAGGRIGDPRLRLVAVTPYRALPPLPRRWVYTYRNPTACRAPSVTP